MYSPGSAGKLIYLRTFDMVGMAIELIVLAENGLGHARSYSDNNFRGDVNSLVDDGDYMRLFELEKFLACAKMHGLFTDLESHVTEIYRGIMEY